MSDIASFTRQWLLLRKLSGSRTGWTVKELATDLNVSDKTVRRDFDVLRGVGFPLIESIGPHGQKSWRCDTDSLLQGVPFTFDEAASLYLAQRCLEPLAGTVMFDAAQRVFRKIRSAFSEPILKYLDQLAAFFHRTSFRNSRYGPQSQLLDDLMVGIEDRRITFLTYQSVRSTEPLTYDVYPYGIVQHRGSLYLVAHSRQHDEVRTFKVDRISDVALEDLRFQMPPDFDLKAYHQHSLGVFHSNSEPQLVRIRFKPAVARYVEEHHWHESQTLTRQKDGTLLAEFQLSDLHEIKSWILSFGAQAEALAPAELREMVENDISKLAEVYSGSQPRMTPSSRKGT